MNPHEMRIPQRMAPGPMPQPSRKVHVPNLITMGRVLLAIVVVALLSGVSARALRAQPSLGDRLGDLTHVSTAMLVTIAVLFIVAALSDALDGHLARKWKVESKFGRVMDPFADKILILGAFVMLAGANFAQYSVHGAPSMASGVETWMVVVILARELLITSLRGMVESKGISFAAIGAGKIKMIAQSVAVPIILLAIAFQTNADPDFARNAHLVAVIAAWATTLITIWSAIPYLTRAWRAIASSAD